MQAPIRLSQCIGEAKSRPDTRASPHHITGELLKGHLSSIQTEDTTGSGFSLSGKPDLVYSAFIMYSIVTRHAEQHMFLQFSDICM